MEPFFSQDEVLAAAEVEVAPGSPQAAHFFQKLIRDSLVRTRAMDLCIDAFLVQAIRQMTAPERDILRKRVGARSAADRPTVTWACILPPDDGLHAKPQPFIRASIGVAGQPGYQESLYDGAPEKAHMLTWRGSTPPQEVLDQYMRLRDVGVLGACDLRGGAAITVNQPTPKHYPLPDQYPEGF